MVVSTLFTEVHKFYKIHDKHWSKSHSPGLFTGGLLSRVLRKFFISSILYIYYIKNFLKSQIFEKFSFWSLVCPSHLLSSVFPLCHSESIAQGDNSESISYGDPTGTRTRICTLKGCCPRPVRRWGHVSYYLFPRFPQIDCSLLPHFEKRFHQIEFHKQNFPSKS